MRRIVQCSLYILVAMLLTAGTAAANPKDADAWVSRTLIPELERQLGSHPRFRGEAIRIVAFAGDTPAARSTEFELELRDRIADRLRDIPGVRVAAEQNAGGRIDCALEDVAYYVGLQASPLSGDRLRLTLRALDADSNGWVTGLESSWQGRLTAGQARAFDTIAYDPYFRGRRSAPFERSETDLLARTLARGLACDSMRQLEGEYVVLVEPDVDTDGAFAGMTELVGNNLVVLSPVRFTNDPGQANAVLSGKAHPVDGGLNQFWATLAPIDADSLLPTLMANAYVRMPMRSKNLVKLPRRDAALLSNARLVEARGRNACRRGGESCMAMQVESNEDTIVFVLNHQRNHGLVRIQDSACRQRAGAHVMRARDTLEVPLPIDAVRADAATATSDWQITPDADTYYALAVSDSRAAHAVARHLRKLPQRCTSAVRFGLRDAELDAWLAELVQTIDPWQDSVDWRAIQVRSVL